MSSRSLKLRSHQIIKRLLAQWAVVAEYTDCISETGRTPPNVCPYYGTKPFKGKAPVILEFREMQSIPSLTSFPGPLGPEVVAPDKFLSMGQIKLFDI